MRRLALPLLLCAALVSAQPALASDTAVTPQARSVDDACPPGEVPEDGFTDVPPDGVHEASVDCVVHWQVARGRGPGRYDPQLTVDRGQMASFLARLVERTGGTLPDATGDHFGDDDGSTHERSIDQLAEAGIVAGRSPGAYDPTAPVTRAQMAAFLVRAYDYRARQDGGAALPDGDDAFHDDDEHVQSREIDRAAAAGFASGYADASYRPAGTVRRDQMAGFLARVLDLAVEQGMASLPTDPDAPRDPPADPGNARDCSDFPSWRTAQDWFERYQPHHGDVARLDPDGDLVACGYLPDAPGSVFGRSAGAHVVDVVQVYWDEPDGRTLADLVDVVERTGRHFSTLTAGRIDVVVGETVPWVEVPEPEQDCDLYALRAHAEAALGYEAAPGRHLLTYLPADSTCISNGFGQSPGDGVWFAGDATPTMLVHELAHNFGMGHADGRFCHADGAWTEERSGATCRQYEGFDPYDLMGSGAVHPQPDGPGPFGLPHLLDLGVVPHADVPEVPVGEDQVVTVRRSSSSTGLRGLTITQDTRRYLVEYRAEPLYEGHPDGDGDPGVLVRIDDPTLAGYAANRMALVDMQPNDLDDGLVFGNWALLPGRVFAPPDGRLTIETLSVDADSATLRLSVR